MDNQDNQETAVVSNPALASSGRLDPKLGWWRGALLLVATIASQCAQALEATATNLALGKSYTLDPAPNYSYSTDSDDLKQLTDGRYSSGRFWTAKSTVGWVNCRPVNVTIDLGKNEPISGVSFNTTGGLKGNEWPLAISIMTSEDGRAWNYAGDLIQLSDKVRKPSSAPSAIHCFRTDQLKTHGRFVLFQILPSTAYTFSDEIEVFKGEDALSETPYTEHPIIDTKAFFLKSVTLFGIQRRLRQDSLSLRQEVTASALPAGVKAQFQTELDSIDRETALLPWPDDRTFKAVLPLNSLHQGLFELQGRFWRALKKPEISLWTTNSYAPLSPIQIPPGRTNVELSLAMMQNEFRAVSFNISSAAEFETKLQIVGLPGGINPTYIQVQQALWTDTRNGLPIIAALPQIALQNDTYPVAVDAGLTRQIWLTFHPTNIPAGTYTGTIVLSNKALSARIPLNLTIAPVRFPDQPTLHFGGWDYTDRDAIYSLTPENRLSVLEQLRGHYVDSPWVTAGTLPHGKFDAAGQMVTLPDTERFDRWFKQWPQARQVTAYVLASEQFEGSKMGTPEFNKKVGAWVKFWADHVTKIGLKPQQVLFALFDEPSLPKEDEIILAWANAIHAAQTGIRVWEDPAHTDPFSANQKMMAACDVLCPNRVDFVKNGNRFRNYYTERREKGAELAFYSCAGPMSELDPYAYCRLQAWTCWQYNAQSSSFWCFIDSGGSSWNEYAASPSYTPYFLDRSSLTPGKHMEAMREGVEDYEYLVMLRAAIAQAEKSGVKGKRLDQAKQLLGTASTRVSEAPGATAFRWAKAKDTTIADQVRLEILQALTTLRN